MAPKGKAKSQPKAATRRAKNQEDVPENENFGIPFSQLKTDEDSDKNALKNSQTLFAAVCGKPSASASQKEAMDLYRHFTIYIVLVICEFLHWKIHADLT